MISRRQLMGGALAAPAILRAQKDKPSVSEGIQFGDLNGGRAIVWARTDRPSLLHVEWATTERFEKKRSLKGQAALAEFDYTTRVDVPGLPAGQTIFVRAWFEGNGVRSDIVSGRFRTPSHEAKDTRLLWTGDCAGQGWGMNPEWGGYRIYEQMLRRDPDLFVHSGDTIYADGPIRSEVKLPDGTVWKNITTEAKSKVAETLDEFRGNYKYNLLDAHQRKFAASTVQLWQWDDHEVMNNWSPSTDLTNDDRYREKDIRKLAARARQAFLEYAPIRVDRSARIHRVISNGPLLDVFLLDMRSYRGPNNYNRQETESPDTAYLGNAQIQWFIDAMGRSKATWKIIAADMPLSLIVGDGKDREGRPKFENSANGDGPPLGRELEIARILRAFQCGKVRNTIWITADTHYTAAHLFDPSKAQFTEFDPFWEFVSGPMNAGTFGPNAVDNTFGMQVAFQKAPPKGQANLPPSAGLQFFGEINVEARTRELSVILRDISGAALFQKSFGPQ